MQRRTPVPRPAWAPPYEPVAKSVAPIIALVVVRAVAEAIFCFELAGFLPSSRDSFDILLLSWFTCLAIQVAQAVVTGLFLARAGRNTRAFGMTGQTWAPGWGIASWFIPSAYLVIPLLVVRETWKASLPSRDQAAWRQNSLPAYVGWWWGLWLGGPFVALMPFFIAIFNIGNSIPPALAVVQYLLLGLGATCMAVGCYLFFKVVRTIAAEQGKRAAERGWRA